VSSPCRSMTRWITVAKLVEARPPRLGANGPGRWAGRLTEIVHMDTRLNTRRKGILLAAMTAVISGFAVFVNGYGVRAWAEVADATTYTTVKNLMAALLIGAFATTLWVRGSAERPAIPRAPRQRWMLGVIAVVGGSVPFVLFFEGLSRASSAQAGFIHKTLIIWVGVAAVLFLNERISWPHVAAIALLVWGQVALLGSVESFSFGAGEVMVLAATLLWSVEVILAKKVLVGVTSGTVAVSRMVGGSVILVAWMLVRGVEIEWAALMGGHLVWILVTGVFLSGYVLTWFAALARAPALDVTAVLVAGAVITAFLQTTIRGIALPDPVGLALLAVGAGLIGVLSWRAQRSL
jgi:drug/metabolite transporter (DMT)-like permease